MQIRPFEELEAFARAEYRRQYQAVPEPTVINVDAVVQFNQPRPFVWGGVGYRAPPLPYAIGMRLLVAANALRDLRTAAKVPEAQLRAAMRLAARAVRGHIVKRYRVIQVFRRFHADDAEQLEGLIRWLLHVPDAAPFEPNMKPGTMDFMDALATFAKDFPAWVTTERWWPPWRKRREAGYPLSWAHYLYGMRHLARARAREDLRFAMATRAGQSSQKDLAEWVRELRPAAGWS